MKVYMVFHVYHGDRVDFLGIFDSKEEAEKCAIPNPEWACFEHDTIEFDLNKTCTPPISMEVD